MLEPPKLLPMPVNAVPCYHDGLAGIVERLRLIRRAGHHADLSPEQVGVLLDALSASQDKAFEYTPVPETAPQE